MTFMEAAPESARILFLTTISNPKPDPARGVLARSRTTERRGFYELQIGQLRAKVRIIRRAMAPKVIAEMNDYQFKVVKLQGDFIWHDHQDTDETFIVIEGDLRIDFRDGVVHVSSGEMFVVPRGVEHKPYAEHEVKVLLIEPRGVLNTGHAGGSRTAKNDVWI